MPVHFPHLRSRLMGLLLLPLLLAGCGAGGGDTTSAAEAPPSGSSAESVGGSQSTGSGPCAGIDDFALQEAYPDLEPIGGTARQDGGFDCHLWLPEEYVEQTIAAEGVDREYYDGVRKLGVILTVHDEATKTDLSDASHPVVVTDDGLQVQMPPAYAEDGYIVQQYNAANGSQRDVTATIQGFASDVPDKDALDQAMFQLLSSASAQP